MNEPILENRAFNFVLWLLILAVVLGICGLLLRRKSPQNVVARLNAIFGPLLFASAWLYGVVFEPGNNFAAILSDGFWGYWFRLRNPYEMRGHYGQVAVLAGIGVGLLLLFAWKMWRRKSAASGVIGPLVALVFWCLGALTVYFVPWCCADVLTNYTSFTNGAGDVGEFLSALANGGAILAGGMASIAIAVAWFLTARSFRPKSLDAPAQGRTAS